MGVKVEMRFGILLLVTSFLSCGQGYTQPSNDCEWCGSHEVPEDVSWQTNIASPEEPGEKILIRGIVFQPDGETPAEGVILYVYHTNLEGIYEKKGNETGNGKRHGYLRSWMKTDKNGRYEFRTFKPGSYPSGSQSAHIHITIKPPNKDEYWTKSYLFDDDPLLTTRDRKPSHQDPSFYHVLTLKKEGEWQVGERNILLRN